MGEEGPELGAEDEDEAIGSGVIVERLLAHPVAGQQQPPAGRVPDREGEHAIELGNAIVAIDLVGVGDHLGVRARSEAMPMPLQMSAQLREVVDLPVLDHVDGAVLVGEGLLSGLEIDDAQSSSPERDLVIDVEPLVVWPSVKQRVRHATERAAGLFGPSVHEEAGDPAHRVYQLTVSIRSRREHRDGSAGAPLTSARTYRVPSKNSATRVRVGKHTSPRRITRSSSCLRSNATRSSLTRPGNASMSGASTGSDGR